ncbi:uncharacterized protein LOC118175602 [Oxyura jamaicensis]|uniref:uncharacterized protein LOC118175602 n=1 Tax=Oxyura jamaicensis TaxID=8884 RepID=UPI0015A6668A|nr:uncharacterized protein LOC118175602 [Oxyura jamaicensis]
MARAGIAAVLVLTALLPAAAAPCEPAQPQSPANVTAPGLLGTWWYVAGAAQLPQHLLELLLIDHGHLRVEPGAGGQELLVTQHVAAGGRCLSSNSSYFHLPDGGGTALVKHATTQQTMGTLLNLSSEDVLLIQHQLQKERTYSALYLYARNQTVSEAQRDEFARHAQRLGLSEGEIVYAPWRQELCQGEETQDGGAPGTAPPATGPASPAPSGAGSAMNQQQ